MSVLGVRELLALYDEHLRTASEVRGAAAVSRRGPLWVAVYPAGHGFVTYRDLADLTAAQVAELVAAVAHTFSADPRVSTAEWKTRGHDRAPGLHEALVRSGFEPEETESIMLGYAEALAALTVEPPAGVRVRRAGSEADVFALCAMQLQVFGRAAMAGNAEELLRRLEQGDGLQLWLAEVGDEVVSGGRLEPVEGTPFAGLWGGATLPAWRGRGIYRALTSARARAALEAGKLYLHSDSTEFSRPILECSGLVRASTTTPYVWRRPA